MWSLATNGRRPWVARSQQVLPDTTKQVGKQIASLRPEPRGVPSKSQTNLATMTAQRQSVTLDASAVLSAEGAAMGQP